MKGVSFLVNEAGDKTAVILDLKQHRRIWEDMYDRMLVAARKHEPRETLEQVRKRLNVRRLANSHRRLARDLHDQRRQIDRGHCRNSPQKRRISMIIQRDLKAQPARKLGFLIA